ncbi:MAG: hypothetical protein KatS3mg113_0202 [Planctomycetaceae bacterium]|nr:MAG: hypothetical protein KatS3mg113_0202 [Planctomycetaceae bacterium]
MKRLEDLLAWAQEMVQEDAVEEGAQVGARPVRRLRWGEALAAARQPELWQRGLQTWEVARRCECMGRVPIIAVLGELNAGKSSIVASFLSETGRARLPRGIEDRFGTHRFVYWLPMAWYQDDALRSIVHSAIEQVHGHSVELLSDDPQQAAVQYRSGRDHPELIARPLLAYDNHLHAFGFLDCPDVQTADVTTHEDSHHNQRLEFVSQATLICSTLLLVWERAKLRDRLVRTLLGQLRERLPYVPIHLLINKARPCPPGEVFHDPDVGALCEQYRLERVYLSYDLDIPEWRRYTPKILAEQYDQQRSTQDTNDDHVCPIFFALEAEHLHQPVDMPARVGLSALLESLQPSELLRQRVDSYVVSMHEAFTQMMSAIESWMRRGLDNLRAVHADLLNFCVWLFTDNKGEWIQIANPVFNQKLLEAIIRQAPWYVKVADWISGGIQQGIEAVRQRLPFKRLSESIESAKQFAKDMWGASSILTPEDLARKVAPYRFVPTTMTQEELTELWTAVLDRFQRYTWEINESDLELMAQDFWKHAPRGWLAIRSSLMVFGAMVGLGGLITAAIDGGAAMLAGYSLTNWLAAHISSMAALGASAIGTGMTFAIFYRGLVEQNSLPALSAFFAVSCDAWGLPRRVGAEPLKITIGKAKPREFTLLKTSIEPLETWVDLPDVGWWRWTEQAQSLIERLNRMADSGGWPQRDAHGG